MTDQQIARIVEAAKTLLRNGNQELFTFEAEPADAEDLYKALSDAGVIV